MNKNKTKTKPTISRKQKLGRLSRQIAEAEEKLGFVSERGKVFKTENGEQPITKDR